MQYPRWHPLLCSCMHAMTWCLSCDMTSMNPSMRAAKSMRLCVTPQWLSWWVVLSRQATRMTRLRQQPPAAFRRHLWRPGDPQRRGSRPAQACMAAPPCRMRGGCVAPSAYSDMKHTQQVLGGRSLGGLRGHHARQAAGGTGIALSRFRTAAAASSLRSSVCKHCMNLETWPAAPAGRCPKALLPDQVLMPNQLAQLFPPIRSAD